MLNTNKIDKYFITYCPVHNNRIFIKIIAVFGIDDGYFFGIRQINYSMYSIKMRTKLQ